MSLSLQPGGSQTITVAVPQPNFYAVSTARLFVKQGDRSVAQVTPSSTTPTSVVFNVSLSDSQLRLFSNCGDCSWRPGSYTVILYEGGTPLDPPFKVIQRGSVTLSGTVPCLDCGGESPPAPSPPPPGADSPYGEVDAGDTLIAAPTPPGSICLPPSFVMPSPTVPTPCSGSGGTGTSGFSNVP